MTALALPTFTSFIITVIISFFAQTGELAGVFLISGIVTESSALFIYETET